MANNSELGGATTNLIEHKQYITRHGDDMPEVKNWRWPGGPSAG
jgi:phosphoketolase